MNSVARPLASIAVMVLVFGCGGSDVASSGTGSKSGSGAGKDGEDSSASPSSEPAIAELCVKTINDYRKGIGAPALDRWTDGEACADAQCKSDSESGKAHGAFGDCGEFAQDECPGWDGDYEKAIPACLEMMWNEGPGGGHYDNMSNTTYTKVACGVYRTPSGKFWAIQNFK